MAQFNYTARKSSGELVSGILEAGDAATVAQVLAGRSFVPLTISEQQQDVVTLNSELSFFTPKVTLDDLVIFSRQMHSLVKSGIPILRAVKGLADTTASKRMALALEDVSLQLERGRTLSAALNMHKDTFSQLFISIVHVGENTGRLDDAFIQLSFYLEREQETRKQIKAATRYPLFVIFAIIIAMVIMNIVVIPIFANMFTSLGAELPLMTRVLLATSHFFTTQWHVLLLGTLAGAFLLRRYLHTPSGQYRWDKLKLRLPIVGNIFERTLLGRFSRSFSMMLVAGVPMTSALNLVAEAVNNTFMAERIIAMRKNIEKGENLSRVAAGSQLFTPLVLQMISVGEETGRVDELLAEVAEFYEREVDYDLKSLTAKIEPILISVVAGMVLVLALGIFTPMWDMMGAIKG
ncbi:MAG: type II secretion system F family protein [Paraglaciecola sp.]|uniref:type II secretion system F family protein n=1 Tax=Paraglaciecola sp. TaxID=1920173 RepID=UPI00273E8361|nr:type II secretion system F family protein [Paraglaciecola sp.]MDP5031380.1 type II secretion system F family protein [Paraglaciecola sp.]MDP5039396.1 type II secretion system F family protein [Paraglaciecola sp.]MDP5133144.1 type II secretion system F family protein [Paraglaciecola sp.]